MLRVLFLAALTFLTTPAFGQELVVMGLRQGMPYEAARRILIDQGWQAAVTNPMYKDSLQQALQVFFIKRGFHEVEICQPTGLGMCTAVFHDARGRLLYVYTSEPEETSASVASWCLSGNNLNCRR